MEPAAIQLSGLTRDFGTLRALDHVDLRVERGETFGFLGPNGAGKSTTIRILFDLYPPTSGSASVMGHDCQREGVLARSLMGYIPGDLRLYETLTGTKLVSLFTGLRGRAPDEAYVREVCGRLEIDLSRKIGVLSKGNKQKLGVLLAIMHQPPVLVLDEPTSGLDPLIQEEVAGLIDEHTAAGNTVFFSSHVLSEVERMCHRVGFIRRGKLIAVEEVGQLKGRSLHIIEVTFAEPVPVNAFDLPGVRQLTGEGKAVRLEVQDDIDSVIKAIARYPVLDLRTEQPSLDEIFLAYYQEKAEAAT